MHLSSHVRFVSPVPIGLRALRALLLQPQRVYVGISGAGIRIPPPWVFAPLFQLAYPAQKKCDDISATAQDFVMSGLLCLDPAAMLMFMR
jgi:hypothetical protein